MVNKKYIRSHVPTQSKPLNYFAKIANIISGERSECGGFQTSLKLLLILFYVLQ